MSWNYSGNPQDSERDEVRFLMGDTNTADQLVSDQEVAYAITKQSNLRLAAAILLRHLSAVYSRMVTNRVGDVSSNCSDMAKQFKAKADELDPNNMAQSGVVIPVFGGVSVEDKQVILDDEDTVPASFYKGEDDIPGGPSEFGGDS